MKAIQPHQPFEVSLFARACLDALIDANLAERISLGGALGLFHYIDYRSTHDVDAWWYGSLTAKQKDSLSDLAASKMVALVERGAPRDFLDIYTLCQAELLSIDDCWLLWRRRQILAGSDVDLIRAHLAIETHLERISLHRPLEKIADLGQRQNARQLREWFLSDFLQVNDD